MLLINKTLKGRDVEVKLVMYSGADKNDPMLLWSTLNNKLIEYWNSLHIMVRRSIHGLMFDTSTYNGSGILKMTLSLPEMTKDQQKATIAYLRDNYKYVSQMLRGTISEEFFEVPVYTSQFPNYQEGDDPIVFVAYPEKQLLKHWFTERLDNKFEDFADYIENCTAEDNYNL